MYTAIIVLAVSAACSAQPQAGVRGTVSGPVQVTYSQNGEVQTTAYNFEDLGYSADGDLSFLPNNLIKFGVGNLSGGLNGGSVSVKSTENGKTEETKFRFEDFAFEVASRVAGSVDGSVSGPIIITAQKDGEVKTTTYDFDNLRYKAQIA